MIISDEHRFAFVHIPKCAGTSVKRSNPSLHRFQGLRPDGSPGPIQPPLVWHLPLAMLADRYPDTFAQLEAYESFAVVRSPFERFCSALMQHGREFKGMTSSQLFGSSLVKLGREVCDIVEQRTDYMDPVYVHFIPQVDYIALDGRRIVKNLDLPNFQKLNAFFETHGLSPVPFESRSNVSLQPSSSAAASLLRAARPIYQSLLPVRLKGKLWNTMVKAGVFKPASGSYKALRDDQYVMSFLHQHYARDFELFTDVKAKAKPDELREEVAFQIDGVRDSRR